tara:strand:+ start:11 stop:451 length:441 start_codon:yes stop_codon:yes gene_type:complete
MARKIHNKKKGVQMNRKVEKKGLASYAFEGCVQTLIGAFGTFNVNATPKQVEAYKREVEAYTIDEMNTAIFPMGLKVKVRKNLNYMLLPTFAKKIVDKVDVLIDSLGGAVECANGQVLEVGKYIKTPTSKKPTIVKYKKGRSLDKN